MIGYILLGIFILCILSIAILYFINSKKIKQKESKKVEANKKLEDKPTQQKPAKVEVKSQVIKGTMFEEAVKEAEKSGFNYDSQLKSDTASKPKDKSRLKLEREEFVSEIKKADNGRLKPQRLEVERQEGPTNINSDGQKSINKNDIGDEINNLSPELKALLVNDVLNKKY